MQFTKPYAYVSGNPPLKWDIATILREPGHYKLATAIMGTVFGTSLHQRWHALTQLFQRPTGSPDKLAETAPDLAAVKPH